MQGTNRSCFLRGMRDGIPINLGYFAVAFTLGIAARQAGLTAFQAGLASALTNASAGEYAAFTVIAENGTYLTMAIMILVANARYLLMSCALTQKLPSDTPLWQRMIVGFDVTDEIFGVSIAVEGKLNPFYTFGVITVALPGWCLGTVFGVIMGNLLPANLVSALSVGLYGMFLDCRSACRGMHGIQLPDQRHVRRNFFRHESHHPDSRNLSGCRLALAGQKRRHGRG